VVEREHSIEKHQDAIGNIEIIDGVLSDVFETPNNVIGAVTDCTGGKRGQAGHGGRAMLLQEFLDNFENVSVALFDFLAAFDGDRFASRLQSQKRPYAKEGIASDLFTSFYRFQQEGIGFTSGNGEKRRDGGQQIGRDGLRDRNERRVARQLKKLSVVGANHLSSVFRLLSSIFRLLLSILYHSDSEKARARAQ
jgi:hypothetical protein